MVLCHDKNIIKRIKEIMQKKINITSCHKSKGLEWDSVIFVKDKEGYERNLS